MPSNVQVLNWERIYYEEGPEVLYIDRWTKPKMPKETNTKKKQLRPEVEALIKEVQRLRMEMNT